MTGSLIPQYREMHRGKYFWGRSIRHHLDDIAELVVSSGARTLLDYGCGKGQQYTYKGVHNLWGGIMPTLYDPAVKEYERKPVGHFDGVICTDVLEHIPIEELDDVIADLAGYARIWCFASIYCAPATKNLPDGRNVHVTIRKPAWWREKLGRAFNGDAELHLRFRP